MIAGALALGSAVSAQDTIIPLDENFQRIGESTTSEDSDYASVPPGARVTGEGTEAVYAVDTVDEQGSITHIGNVEPGAQTLEVTAADLAPPLAPGPGEGSGDADGSGSPAPLDGSGDGEGSGDAEGSGEYAAQQPETQPTPATATTGTGLINLGGISALFQGHGGSGLPVPVEGSGDSEGSGDYGALPVPVEGSGDSEGSGDYGTLPVPVEGSGSGVPATPDLDSRCSPAPQVFCKDPNALNPGQEGVCEYATPVEDDLSTRCGGAVYFNGATVENMGDGIQINGLICPNGYDDRGN